MPFCAFFADSCGYISQVATLLGRQGILVQTCAVTLAARLVGSRPVVPVFFVLPFQSMCFNYAVGWRPIRLEAIAIRLEAIATRSEAILGLAQKLLSVALQVVLQACATHFPECQGI